jgi:hypothetical protein
MAASVVVAIMVEEGGVNGVGTYIIIIDNGLDMCGFEQE